MQFLSSLKALEFTVCVGTLLQLNDMEEPARLPQLRKIENF